MLVSIDDLTSRVNKLTYNGTDVVSYAYTGEGLLVSTTLTQFSDDRYSRAYVSGSPRAYGNLDQFGRITSSRWTADASGTNIYKVDLTYDRGSNILTADDARLNDSAQKGRFDAVYTMDSLDRLLRTKEGNLSGGSVSDSEDTRNEEWRDATPASALSQTGNWMRRRLDLNGDGDFTDAGIGEIDDTGTFNKANEWGTRDLDSNSGTTGDNYTITHDAVGNMTDDGKDWKYEYDAFGRLRKVKNQSNALKAEYTYNGLGYRIGWHYDVDGDGTVEDTTDDPWFYFAYDERWRIIATIRSYDEEPKERFLYHAAGSRGLGGSSYIDSIILRDRDNNGDWGEEASDTDLETRIYYCQNWRADVSAVLNSSGGIVEWVKYSSYGVPHGITLADWDADGQLSAADVADYASDYTNTRDQADVDFSGSVTSADLDLFTAAYNSGAGQVAGRGVLSGAVTANRVGYAGYQWDAPTTVYHVRHRVYRADLGRWTRRDPLGTSLSGSLYEYADTRPIVSRDPTGTVAAYGHITSPDTACGAPGFHYDPITNSCVRDGDLRIRCIQIPNGIPGSHCWLEYDDNPFDFSNDPLVCSADATRYVPGLWGPILTYCGPESDSPESQIPRDKDDLFGGVRTTPINCPANADRSGIWECIEEVMAAIKACEIDYHPITGPNSNTTIRFAFNHCAAGSGCTLLWDPPRATSPPVGWDGDGEALIRCLAHD